MFLKLTPPSTDTPTPLTSTYRYTENIPSTYLPLSTISSPLFSLRASFFVLGERPVKSAVYYVFRSHPDKNTRHARTTHSALFLSLLSPRFLPTYLPFAPCFLLPYAQPDGERLRHAWNLSPARFRIGAGRKGERERVREQNLEVVRTDLNI